MLEFLETLAISDYLGTYVDRFASKSYMKDLAHFERFFYTGSDGLGGALFGLPEAQGTALNYF